MKKIIIVLLLFILNISCGPYKVTPLEERSIEKIIYVPNQTKDELYTKVNQWFIRTFNSPKSIIEFQDKQQGIVSGKYVTHKQILATDFYYRQVIEVKIKENKVKIFIGDLNIASYTNLSGIGSSSESYKPVKSGYSKIKPTWLELINSLESYLKKNNSDDDF